VRGLGSEEGDQLLQVKPTEHLQLALPHEKYAHGLFLGAIALK
jgi:hypothetical protein